jgi:proline iminopeptidase
MDDYLVTDDGCRIWTAQAGHGDPLVLCHGGPGLWDYLEDVAGLLNDRYRTVRWDQRGCGRSQRCGPYTIARSVADLDAVRRHAAAPRIGLLGHSWGALLALRYTLEYPDRVSRLIYVSGTGIDPESTWRPTFSHNAHQRVGEHTPRLAELRNRDRTADEDREFAVLQWSAEFADPTTALRHAEHLATPWLGINDECSATINAEIKRYLQDNDVAALCHAIEVPTLIVDGDRDPRPRWSVDSLHRALREVRRVTIAGAGHLPWVEDPDGFRTAVDKFDLTRRAGSADTALGWPETSGSTPPAAPRHS